MPNRKRYVAIVEDNAADADRLLRHIARYQKETQNEFITTVFKNGLDFLDAYHPGYDIIYMDIELPGLDGMKTAKRLRMTDPYVGLIFITNMAQYAVKGYEVDALDFIVKPVEYFSFVEKMQKVFARLDRISDKRTYHMLELGSGELRKVACDDIYYILKDRNYIVYTTGDGEFRVRGTMKAIEQEFKDSDIVKCANGCMVNLRHVQKKVRNVVYVNGMQFTVTAPYYDEFTKLLMEYFRGAK